MMQTEEWPAPARGWVQSGNLATAPKDAAEVLDNFFPMSQGVRLRRGKKSFADLGGSVKRLMAYSSGADDLLASTDAAIFDADRVNGDGDNSWAEYEGLGSGDWSVTQISTSGGNFMIGANGLDHAFYYDGAAYNPITAETINELTFDAQTGAFLVGGTVTGGTSGATATILGITKTSAVTGALKVGAITGIFQDNEALTDASTGAATSNIPAGTSVASSVSITGIATAALSQTWIFKERLFFVEKDSMSVWYLPVQSIGGAAAEINLGSVFRRGGYILFGATWSIDSGSGIDDVCIFVTTNGEVAVYQGVDPSNSSTWALSGVYDIGAPSDKHAFFKAGGDLAILTKDGIISVSEAIGKDRAALQGGAITYPIEDAWQNAVAQTSAGYPVTATLWQSRTMLFVGVPTTDGGTNVAYVANSRTGAWCRYTGWDVRCAVVSGDLLYFGSGDGVVYLAESGGEDAGVSYTALCVPKFSAGGVQNKFLTRAQVITRSARKPTVKVKGLTDYRVPEITPPITTDVFTGSTWGFGVWGTFVWGGESEKSTWAQWKKVSGKGFALSLAALVTSNNSAAADIEILGFKVRYEAGTVL